jgi:hypothetical protein
VVDVCKVGGEEKTSFTPIELLTANGPDSTSLQVLADYIILGIQNEEQAVGMVTMTVAPDLTRKNIGDFWLSCGKTIYLNVAVIYHILLFAI